MKKWLLCVAVLAVLVVNVQVAAAGSVRTGNNKPGGPTDSDPGIGHSRYSKDDDENEGPVRPVPEPGTMALASMGLIALGAAARRYRS